MAGDVPGPGQSPGPLPRRAGGSGAPLALYRRYRPATFAEVKGQDHVTEPLRQALRSGRVNHAYLFSGPRGCGKTSSARILARSLNCEQGPTPDPCGVCASCVALAPAGPGSIDVIEIDAASHGGVDDARDLRERAFYAPVSARFKIYIIDEAHMVTREGFNALLKLVEEPPPHLKFVFATTEPEKVIPTIRSRTHHYPFRLMPPAVLRELLEESWPARASRRAGGAAGRDPGRRGLGPRLASVLDQLIAAPAKRAAPTSGRWRCSGTPTTALLDEVVDAFAAGDAAAVFGAIDRVVEGGHDLTARCNLSRGSDRVPGTAGRVRKRLRINSSSTLACFWPITRSRRRSCSWTNCPKAQLENRSASSARNPSLFDSDLIESNTTARV